MLRRTGPASGSKTIRSRVHDTLSTVKSGSPLEREHLVDGGTGQRLARLARAAAEVWRQHQSAAPAAPPARAARSRRSRGLRGSAGRAARPGQPPQATAAGRHPGRPRRGRPATTAPHGAPGRRLRLDALPRGPSRARDGQPDRNPRGPSHHAQGGGIWPDGAGMPDPQPQAPHQPTRHPSRPLAGELDSWPTSLAPPLAPGGLSACHGVHRPPGSKGRADRPARQSQEGSAMTEASVSFAGNLTDDPEVRHTEGGIARAMFRVAVSGRRDLEASFFTVIVWRDQAEHAAQSLTKGSRIVVWVGSSSGPGPPRTAASDPPWRSWPRSWDRASVGRRQRRPRRRGAPASSQLHQPR
jgi:Single-strand binding protein family